MQLAQLTKEASRLSADAEIAHAQIAEANARALEARLALEKFKAPRSIALEQAADISNKLTSFKGTRFDISAISGAQKRKHSSGQ